MAKLGALALIAALALGVAAPAAADLSSDLSDVQRRIEALRSQAGDNRSSRTAAANALLDVAAELDVAAAELDAAQGRLAETEASIATAEADMAVLQDRMSQREERLAEIEDEQDELLDDAQDRAVVLYMQARQDLGTPAVPEDVGDGLVGVLYAARVTEEADIVFGNFEALRLEQEREVALLQGEQATLEETLAWLEWQRSDHEAETARVEAQAEALRAEVAAHRAALDAIDREIAEIDGEIAALAREENRIRAVIASEQTSAGSAPGILLRPVPGSVTSGYGYRTHPIFGGQRLHTGWDMTASCGTPIKSGAAGRVIYSGWRGGYGNTVIVDHGGGMATLYAHQSSIGASYGQQVGAGEVVGWVGTTGDSTGCHLHFEVRIGGNPIDPSPYM